MRRIASANFDPATGQLYYATDGSIEDRALVAPDRNNFGPRLGIVYKANTATVIRGGYGIYYNLVERMGSEDQLSLNPPGLRNISITAPAGSTTPAFILRNGFPPNYLDVSNINYRSLLLRTAQRDGKSSMFHQFAVGLERQVSTSFVASADVIGSLGRNITLLRNLNQPANGNGARPVSELRRHPVPRPCGRSRYRGLDLSLEKRFSRGHSYRVSYTIGDQRDNTPEHLSAASPRPQNTNDLDAWEGAGRQRHPASIRRQLHCGPAARPQPDSARLARRQHPDGAYRPAVYRHARAASRAPGGCRIGLPTRKVRKRSTSGSTSPTSRSCRRGRSATRAETSCADRAGSRSTSACSGAS